MPGDAGQLRKLSRKNQNRKRTDKTRHHRARDKTHQRTEPDVTRDDGKSDRLGNKSQRHHKTCQQIIADVGKLILSD